jgi:hypothetical protein
MMCSMRLNIAARQGLRRSWAVQSRVWSRLTEVTRRIRKLVCSFFCSFYLLFRSDLFNCCSV